MRARPWVLAVIASALILGGCMWEDDDDDHDRVKLKPGHGVTPIPAPKITKPTVKPPTHRPQPIRPAPAPPRKVK